MIGNMMFQPLLISSLIEHAARYHADTAIISKNTDGSMLHTDWGQIAKTQSALPMYCSRLALRSATVWPPSHGIIIVT